MGPRSRFADEIRKFVLKQFPAARYKEFSDDDSMLDNGIIDSMGVLELVGFIEKTYGITVSDDDLTPDNFQSIHSLADYLGTKRNDPG